MQNKGMSAILEGLNESRVDEAGRAKTKKYNLEYLIAENDERKEGKRSSFKGQMGEAFQLNFLRNHSKKILADEEMVLTVKVKGSEVSQVQDEGYKKFYDYRDKFVRFMNQAHSDLSKLGVTFSKSGNPKHIDSGYVDNLLGFEIYIDNDDDFDKVKSILKKYKLF